MDQVIATTLESTSVDATHWSTRRLGAHLGLSQSAVSRIWRAFGLQPHRSETFKLSRDPLFIDKVRDMVGLYLAPPDRALVLCVDEKPQVQATGRQLARGSFALEHAIKRYVTTTTNADPKPFVWTQTADEILDSVARYCQRTSASHH